MELVAILVFIFCTTPFLVAYLYLLEVVKIKLWCNENGVKYKGINRELYR